MIVGAKPGNMGRVFYFRSEYALTSNELARVENVWLSLHPIFLGSAEWK